MVVALTFASRAGATPISGDSYLVTFTETGPCYSAFADTNPSVVVPTCPDPGVGSVTVAEIVLGAAVTPGVFSLASVTAVQGGPGPLLSLDFSAVRFDAATLGLSGNMFETFTGGGGGLRSDSLALTDPGKTWILYDDHVTGGFTVITNGTYTVDTVPEPVTLCLVGTGVAFIVARRRQRT
jgi:hypothetical protein